MKDRRVGIIGRAALVGGLLLSGGCTAEGDFASSTAAQPVGSTAVVTPEQQAQALVRQQGNTMAQQAIDRLQSGN